MSMSEHDFPAMGALKTGGIDKMKTESASWLTTDMSVILDNFFYTWYLLWLSGSIS